MNPSSPHGFPAAMSQAAHPDALGWLETSTNEVAKKVETYVREQPVPAICWALGIGFVLGWRLKPW